MNPRQNDFASQAKAAGLIPGSKEYKRFIWRLKEKTYREKRNLANQRRRKERRANNPEYAECIREKERLRKRKARANNRANTNKNKEIIMQETKKFRNTRSAT